MSKRKIKKSLRAIFKLSTLLLIIIIIKETFFPSINIGETFDFLKKDKNKPSIEYSENKINYKDYITNNSETNKNEVKEYLANGMEIDNFKNILSKESKYITSKEKYKPVQYNFERHYKYEELSELYEQLALSEIVKVEVLGESFDKRKLYSLEIGKGKDKIMLEGNIHGAEIAPTLFLTKFAIDIVNNWETGSEEIIDLLENHTIIILPSANPDGYDYSLFGKQTINNKNSYVYKNYKDIDEFYYKANMNGVDINRNFPSQLGGLYLKDYELYYTVSRDKSPNILEYFGGYDLGSEPETQSIIYWMYKHYKETHAYISLHSAGQVIYNGKPNMSDKFNKDSRKCAEIVNEYSRYTILELEEEIDGDGTDGTSTDMFTEISNEFKFSTDTGRLSTKEYITQNEKVSQNLCVLTVETLEKYTQNLKEISDEWSKRHIKDFLIALTEYKIK